MKYIRKEEIFLELCEKYNLIDKRSIKIAIYRIFRAIAFKLVQNKEIRLGNSKYFFMDFCLLDLNFKRYRERSQKEYQEKKELMCLLKKLN